MTQVIQNVSDTAFMVAGFRAAETERERPLFRDPLAAKIAGEHGRNILATVPKSFVGAWSVVIRTGIIDGLIEQAVRDGVDTILNLGAGLDTRPYRMDLPRSLRFVEVDFPDVIALKEARLADEEPRCRLERVALDLTDRAVRTAFLDGMNAQEGKILVLTEGVTPYLTDEDVGELADDLRQTEKVRYWIVDYFSPEAIKYGAKLRRKFMRNAPFQFAPKDWFAFFAAWLEGERAPLYLRGSRPARAAHSSAARFAALGEGGWRLRLAHAPRTHEALRRLCAADPKMSHFVSGCASPALQSGPRYLPSIFTPIWLIAPSGGSKVVFRIA
jgi:methyltransferase (TIGR00027 family)